MLKTHHKLMIFFHYIDTINPDDYINGAVWDLKLAQGLYRWSQVGLEPQTPGSLV